MGKSLSPRSRKPLSREVQKLLETYQNGLYGLLVLVWLVIGIPSLFALRDHIRRLLEYFTWTAVKYMLFYKPGLASLGLLFCVAVTLYVLLTQSRLEVFGLFESERDSLDFVVSRIQRLRSNHPLRRWLFETKALPSSSGSNQHD